MTSWKASTCATRSGSASVRWRPMRPGPTGTETADDARIDVQRHVPLRADFIKLHLDGVPQDLKPDVIAAAIDEAHKHNMSTAVHIIYLRDAKTAIAGGV